MTRLSIPGPRPMAQQVYPPSVIVRTLIDAFLPYRRLKLVPRGLAPEAQARAFSTDEVIRDMEQFYYVRLDALREAPRGKRDWVVILILSADGKFSHHGPDLRRLLDGVGLERQAKEGRLDELIVVAEKEFFSKKNVMDVISKHQEGQASGPDPEGETPFCSAHPYHNFALVVPESQIVPPHRIMSPEEVETFLGRERLTLRDLPVISASDPPIVWLGGRAGQVVEIERPSQTAGQAFFVRRIE